MATTTISNIAATTKMIRVGAGYDIARSGDTLALTGGGTVGVWADSGNSPCTFASVTTNTLAGAVTNNSTIFSAIGTLQIVISAVTLNTNSTLAIGGNVRESYTRSDSTASAATNTYVGVVQPLGVGGIG